MNSIFLNLQLKISTQTFHIQESPVNTARNVGSYPSVDSHLICSIRYDEGELVAVLLFFTGVDVLDAA